ncbi:MAG: PilZ domain-containing protein [Spirochaetia bacterium]
MEKRVSQRIEVNMRMELMFRSGKKIYCKVENVSDEGCLLKIDPENEENSSVSDVGSEVRVSFVSEKLPAFRQKAKIMRFDNSNGEKYYGLRFSKFSQPVE